MIARFTRSRPKPCDRFSTGARTWPTSILQAFIARRQLLRESGDFTGLRVMGSRYSQDTFRIRDFLAKNRVLFTWLDLERDPAVNLLLQRFGLSEADTPVVACGRKLLLRNPSNLQLAEAIGIRHPLRAGGVRPGRGRGRTRGAGRRSLRRLGGPEHGGTGADGARGPGRDAACASRITSASRWV